MSWPPASTITRRDRLRMPKCVLGSVKWSNKGAGMMCYISWGDLAEILLGVCNMVTWLDGSWNSHAKLVIKPSRDGVERVIIVILPFFCYSPKFGSQWIE